MAENKRGKRSRHHGSDFRPPSNSLSGIAMKGVSPSAGPSVLTKAVTVAVYRNIHQEETPADHLIPRKSLTKQLHLKIWEQDKEFSDPSLPNSFANPLSITKQLLKAEPGTPLTKTVDVQVRKADGTVVTERHPLPGVMVDTYAAQLLWKSDKDLLSNSRSIGEFPLHRMKRETAYTHERITDKDAKPLPANLGPGMMLVDTVITTDEGFKIPDEPAPVDTTTFERCDSCFRAKAVNQPCMCGYTKKTRRYNPIP